MQSHSAGFLTPKPRGHNFGNVKKTTPLASQEMLFVDWYTQKDDGWHTRALTPLSHISLLKPLGIAITSGGEPKKKLVPGNYR